MKNKKKNYLKIISQIENIRKKNNINWMDILRVAFKYNPTATVKIMSKIYSDDKEIGKLVKKLI
jgi:type IV secretory pathway component VirB8